MSHKHNGPAYSSNDIESAKTLISIDRTPAGRGEGIFRVDRNRRKTIPREYYSRIIGGFESSASFRAPQQPTETELFFTEKESRASKWAASYRRSTTPTGFVRPFLLPVVSSLSSCNPYFGSRLTCESKRALPSLPSTPEESESPWLARVELHWASCKLPRGHFD